jgi:transcriptional antiterminator RfaH
MLQLADAPWYVAQVRPNALHMAVRGLTRQGFGLFLPKVASDKKKTAGVELPWTPLFPGYIFVRFDPTRPAWRAINSTRGVAKLVGFGAEGPRPVPRGLIGDLQARCNENGLLLAPNDLAPGDRVLVLRGPFADFVTEIERIEPDRRIWLLIEIMGRKTRVGVEFDDLARA